VLLRQSLPASVTTRQKRDIVSATPGSRFEETGSEPAAVDATPTPTCILAASAQQGWRTNLCLTAGRSSKFRPNRD
jgi:hypothetical protein